MKTSDLSASTIVSSTLGSQLNTADGSMVTEAPLPYYTSNDGAHAIAKRDIHSICGCIESAAYTQTLFCGNPDFPYCVFQTSPSIFGCGSVNDLGPSLRPTACRQYSHTVSGDVVNLGTPYSSTSTLFCPSNSLTQAYCQTQYLLGLDPSFTGTIPSTWSQLVCASSPGTIIGQRYYVSSNMSSGLTNIHASTSSFASTTQTTAYSTQVISTSALFVTSSPSPSPAPNPTKNAGAIAGGIVGGVAIVATIAVGVYLLMRRTHKKNTDSAVPELSNMKQRTITNVVEHSGPAI